ncbi:hypothetical protein L6164_007648 [Bauhinia variegata]|uniref:Uncharacterized protein n=1 Tax=Bauhinia variegata TaxID=167791 RepID=A0ACB9PDH6_BAUVA|nr:hypothetical protein L6164_007648 [Bauhinia variegata]
MRRFLRSQTMVECKGKLLLVAAVEKSKFNVPRSLRMWSLQVCGTKWVEKERMPQQLYIQFAELVGGSGLECVGIGNKVLLFDICRKRWQRIPPCLYTTPCELHGFAYEPRLATLVSGLLDQLTPPFHQAYNAPCALLNPCTMLHCYSLWKESHSKSLQSQISESLLYIENLINYSSLIRYSPEGSNNLSPYSMTLVSGFLAVISINVVIAFYIYMVMREPADKHVPDPKFLSDAKASVNQQPTGEAQQSTQLLKKKE